MRQPTTSEWAYLSATFPKLELGNVWVTGEATGAYNCIAWSMGYTNQWINPRSPLSAFQAQYLAAGFAVTGAYSALIDGWGTSQLNMTHASRRSGQVTGLWTSKLGKWIRITHGRDELEGATYGTILTHFGSMSGTEYAGAEAAETRAAEEAGAGVAEARVGAMLNSEEANAIEVRVAEVDPALRAEFDRRLSAWKASFQDHLVSSDTRDYATGPQYDALVSLGRPVLPLIMHHLADDDGFFLLPLLDALQGQLAAQPAGPLESEQSRALRTLRQWLSDTGN